MQGVNLGTAVFFSLVALYFYKFSGQFLYQIPKFFLLPLTAIEKSVGGIFSVFQQENFSSEPVKKDSTSALIRGLIITVPIFLALLLLLTKADPIFGKLTRQFLANIGERAIVSLILFIILLGFGLSKFLDQASAEEETTHIPAGKSYELAVILGSVLILFALFIIVQFKYLFSSVGEGELNQLGISSLTYSEYVRKGFFELLIAATIASGLIVYVFKYLYHFTGRQKLFIQIFSGFLTVETALILLSAVKRIFLYADTHGLTRARVFGFIFLIWLAVMLAIFLIRIFREMKKEQLFAATLISILFAFFLINLVNIDNLIAAKYKPTVNNEVDYYYISSLSTDASDSWKAGLADSERIIVTLEGIDKLSTEDNRKIHWTRLTLRQFYAQAEYLIDKYGTFEQVLNWHKNDQGTFKQELRFAKNENQFPNYIKQQRKWQSLNFSEYLTFKSMENDQAYFDKIPDLLNRISQLEKRVSDEILRATPLDRSTQPPLL